MEEQPDSKQGLTLPFYKYLGPGNPLNLGEPKNELDAAAKTHDESYHRITEEYKRHKDRVKFEVDIKKADVDFLYEVSLVEPQSTYDKFAKFLAQGGIGTKFLLEHVMGVLYPNPDMTDGGASGDDGVPANVSSVIGGGVQNTQNTHQFQYKKKITFAIPSIKATYTKDSTSVTYKTYIHSLPWQYIFFYMTEKEYMDMTKIFHTARVTGAGLKITNLGNRTPFITSTNSVNYANANSQTTIGIWENLEKMCPVKMGTKISSESLYGKTLDKYATGADQDPDHSTAQAKLIENNITYTFSINDTSKHFHLPPLIMESKILYNATNSIGPIYEKSYTPTDGTFHTSNDGFEENLTILRNSGPMQTQNISSHKVAAIAYSAPKTKKYDSATIDNMTMGGLTKNPPKNFMGSVGIGIIPLLNKDGSLEDAILNVLVETYINLEAVSHGTNLLMSDHTKPQPNTNYASLGVDKFHWNNRYTVSGAPAMEQNTSTEESATDANTRRSSPPTTHATGPNANTTSATATRKSAEQSATKTTTEKSKDTQHRAPSTQPPQAPQQEAPPTQPPQAPVTPTPVRQPSDTSPTADTRSTEDQPQPGPSRKRPKEDNWWEIGEMEERGKYRFVKGDSVPGQSRITGRMGEVRKLEIAENNERIRTQARETLKSKGIQIMYYGKNTPMGMPDNGGFFNDERLDHLYAILTVGGGAEGRWAKNIKEEITRRAQGIPPRLIKDLLTTEEDQIQAPPTIQPQPQPQPQVTPQPPTIRSPTVLTMLLYHLKGEVYLYEKQEQIKNLERYKKSMQVKKQPPEDEIEVRGINRNAFWFKLGESLPTLTSEEQSDLYNMMAQSIDYNLP